MIAAVIVAIFVALAAWTAIAEQAREIAVRKAWHNLNLKRKEGAA